MSAPAESGDLLRFVVCGSVDDGKSTLLGRLLYDAELLMADRLEEARSVPGDATARANDAGLDLSLLTDGLRAEREQGITIDVAHRSFRTPRRAFVAADVPGHEQYTRNMATGASTASVALLLVDATKGLTTQTKRHAFLCTLLGASHLVLCVNKLDLSDDPRAAFGAIQRAFTDFATRLELRSLDAIPISAFRGDNVVRRSEAWPWYDGLPLLRMLETIHVASDRNAIDLRFPVQLVLRADGRRRYAGQVASGVLRVGDEVAVLPSARQTRVTAIHTPQGDQAEAFPPLSISVSLADDLDVARGDLLVHPHNQPRAQQQLDVMLVWLDATPLDLNRRYALKHLTRTVSARVTRLHYVVDPDTLRRTSTPRAVAQNDVGRVVLRLSEPLAVDPYPRNRATGALILIDPERRTTLAAGLILDRAPQPAAARSRGGVVWLTGLSGAGKTTLARALEDDLRADGIPCAVLDGDQLRAGLSRDLGFSPADRRENVRRAAEVARLLADAGQVAIVALISPSAVSRAEAKAAIGAERFVEVHVATDLAACRARDPKGLYARADAGELPEFTGVSAPYDVPEAPALTIDAAVEPVSSAVAQLRVAIAALA